MQASLLPSGIPHFTLQRGIDELFVFKSQSIPWAEMDEIHMDIKSVHAIEGKALLTFKKSNNTITIDGIRIFIPLTAAQTKALPKGEYFYDIKRVLGGKILPPAPGRITMIETVSNPVVPS